MLKLLFLLQVCCTCLYIHGQSATAMQLRIGDTLPDITLGYLMDQPDRAVHSGDLKGTLTILDFWDGSCSACLREMPHLDSLQQQFKGRMRIILITRSTTPQVKALFQKVKIKQPRLDMINGDQSVHSLFPFNTVPHHVWIDSAGIVRFITGGSSTTATHIQRFLAGSPLNLVYKKEWPDFDPEQSLLQEGRGRLLPHLQSYSLLMDKVEYGGGTYVTRIDSARKQLQVKIINQSLLFLYRFAFSGTWNGGAFKRDDRVVVAVNDGAPFGIKTGIENADTLAYYCYELSLPYSEQERYLKRIQTDLNSFLPYKAAIEQRRISCWVLTKAPGEVLAKGSSGPARFEEDQNTWLFQGQPLSAVIDILPELYTFFDAPLVDGTGCKGTIDLKLPTQISSIEELRNVLKRFGLALVKEEQFMDVLCITDKS